MPNTGANNIATHASILCAAVVLCSIVETTLAATNKTQLCFKGSEADPAGNVTLACPDNQVITIDEALFGRSKWLRCAISDGDCVEKTKIFQECENRNNCSRTFKTYSTKCGYASVIFISYTCLQVDPVSVYTSTYATVPATKKAELYGGSQVHDSGKSSGLVNRESGRSPTETGLIAGCVVAAVVTVIFLVIAITMVVRRLMHKNNPDDDDDDAEADSSESKIYTCCACLSCFSHIRNCLSYHENKHDFKAAKMTTDAAVVSPTNKHVYVNHKPSTESTDNSLNFTDTKGQVSSDDRIINIQTVGEDNQLDSNSNPRMKNIIAKENAGRDNGSENLPLVTDVLNEDINSMNKQQNCTVPDNSSSEMAKDAQENNISPKEKPNSTASGLSEEQQMPTGNKDQTHSGNHPTYDAVSIPNTEQGTIC